MAHTDDVSLPADLILRRLDAIDAKLAALTTTRTKSLEWMAQLSENVRSLDVFREEVRATLEPLFSKLDALDETARVLRHATSDVSRRLEGIERDRRPRAIG